MTITPENEPLFILFSDGKVWDIPWMILERRDNGVFVHGGYFGDHLFDEPTSYIGLDMERVYIQPGEKGYLLDLAASFMRSYPNIGHGYEREELEKLVFELNESRIKEELESARENTRAENSIIKETSEMKIIESPEEKPAQNKRS